MVGARRRQISGDTEMKALTVRNRLEVEDFVNVCAR